jgi:hypothetical protein
MSGICRCGHVDAAHFDEVLHCGACPCERFWDRASARRPRPIPNRDPADVDRILADYDGRFLLAPEEEQRLRDVLLGELEEDGS